MDVADESDDQSQKDDGIDYDVGDMLAGQFFRIHDWPPLLLQCVLTCFENANIQKIARMGSVSWRQVSVKSGYKASGGGHDFRSGHGFRGRHGSAAVMVSAAGNIGYYLVKRRLT